jgi:hypothetical protein
VLPFTFKNIRMSLTDPQLEENPMYQRQDDNAVDQQRRHALAQLIGIASLLTLSPSAQSTTSSELIMVDGWILHSTD